MKIYAFFFRVNGALGHDIQILRQQYRLPQGTLQLAKMSKVLTAMEKGTLSQYKGKSLDEIDPKGTNMLIDC